MRRIFSKKEVINILVAEYDYDTDIAVQRAEAGRIAFAEGREQGITQGITQGISQGISQGSRQAKLETAKLLKQLGDSVQKIMQVTWLSKSDVEGAWKRSFPYFIERYITLEKYRPKIVLQLILPVQKLSGWMYW